MDTAAEKQSTQPSCWILPGAELVRGCAGRLRLQSRRHRICNPQILPRTKQRLRLGGLQSGAVQGGAGSWQHVGQPLPVLLHGPARPRGGFRRRLLCRRPVCCRCTCTRGTQHIEASLLSFRRRGVAGEINTSALQDPALHALHTAAVKTGTVGFLSNVSAPTPSPTSAVAGQCHCLLRQSLRSVTAY